MIKSPAKVICDAGPVIHLDEVNCLDLLDDFDEIIIPITVEKEIEEHRPSALHSSSLTLKRHVGRVEIGEKLLALCKVFSLDAGETEALALMERNPQAIFLTDDAAARLVAEQMRYNVHGTIGILIRSIRRGQRNPKEILIILSELAHKSTLHIKPSLLNEISIMLRKEFDL
jgi:predicted nucleic acid-binding protein